jgi:hypothetical protein
MRTKDLLTALLFSFFVSGSAFGLATKTDDTSSTNLATTYSTASTSLLITGLGMVPKRRVEITNTSAGLICCHVSNPSTTAAPSSGDGTELCVPSNGIKAWDDVPVQKNVYCRSASGSTISSGYLLIEVW